MSVSVSVFRVFADRAGQTESEGGCARARGCGSAVRKATNAMQSYLCDERTIED